MYKLLLPGLMFFRFCLLSPNTIQYNQTIKSAIGPTKLTIMLWNIHTKYNVLKLHNLAIINYTVLLTYLNEQHN